MLIFKIDILKIFAILNFNLFKIIIYILNIKVSCFVAFDDSLDINDLLVNKKEYVTNLQVLNRSYDAIFAQLIIDLYKLSKKKEDYSIPKLLNKLMIHTRTKDEI